MTNFEYLKQLSTEDFAKFIKSFSPDMETFDSFYCKNVCIFRGEDGCQQDTESLDCPDNDNSEETNVKVIKLWLEATKK